ncbi:MAG: type II toxin-antitoxin system VapC family toxin [Terracidiphilus sp.]
MSVLLDTDIAIEIQRARDQSILSKWSNLIASGEAILCSPVVVAEVWAGARPREHQFIENFFDALICVTADYETGRLAGELMHRYAGSHSLETPDALVAASAIQHQAVLWTRNRKHYPMPQLTFYS